MTRPTDHVDEVVRFYSDGLGLTTLGSFEDHEGFDGVMLGVPGAPYHFEFTKKRGYAAGRASTRENLLVFYLPDESQWQAAVDRMMAAGYEPVASVVVQPILGSRRPYIRRPGRLPRSAAERRLVGMSELLIADRWADDEQPNGAA